MKTLKVLVLILMFVLIFDDTAAQEPACNVYCKNITQLTASSFQFDVTILRTGGTAFNYTKGQYAFSYNTAIRPSGTGGTWTLNITASDLPALKQCTILLSSTSTNGQFILWGQADNTSDYFVSDAAEVLVARVVAALSVPFETQPLNLVWRTDTNPFTKLYYNASGISTIVPSGNLSYSMTNGEIGLPVEISSFDVLPQEREINLTWSTKTEINSYMFEIERAFRQVGTSLIQEWKRIGNITASGNSNSPKEYSFADTKLNSGKYSYRLKMIDNDGTFKYSDIVEAEIELPKEYSLSQNYPNAFNPTTRIDYQLPFDSKVTINLYGITGEKVATIINKEVSAGYHSAEINAGEFNLASGVYIYRMTAKNLDVQNSETVIFNKKLMLMK